MTARYIFVFLILSLQKQSKRKVRINISKVQYRIYPLVIFQEYFNKPLIYMVLDYD